jgi:hypothetical protein
MRPAISTVQPRAANTGSGPTCDGAAQGGCGTVFELKPNAGGGWTETVLHNFGNGHDGSLPLAGLIFDDAGNLYGTTLSGGTGLQLPRPSEPHFVNEDWREAASQE